eukprot:TRINITY_DN20059_c0_g2_i1.p1 TRINITY_DN20059_c0_g2~~TRINITY_DN20059_c0_g2_i1.p1  ORF type:complete len:877 (-),score=115.65 TRINITY_DN20059_c0_g2_i1:532-3120(-)
MQTESEEAVAKDSSLLDFTCGKRNWLDVHFCESDAPGAPEGELLPVAPPAENMTTLDVESVRASMFRSQRSNSGAKLSSSENTSTSAVNSVISLEAEIEQAHCQYSVPLATMPSLLRSSHHQPRFSDCDKQFLKSHFDQVRSWCKSGAEADAYCATHQMFTFTYKSRKCRGLAIHVAAMHKCGFEVFARLLELKANLRDECSYTSFGKDGRTQPVVLAAGCGHVKNVKELLNLRADIHAQGRHDEKPHAGALHDAAFNGHTAVANLLIRQEADISLMDSSKQTPLHTAARAGAADIASMLLRRQADPAAKDADEMTPLYLAIYNGAFPAERLHLLAQPLKSDFMWIALNTPPHRMEAVLRKYSSQELPCHDRLSQETPPMEGFNLKDFLHLMKTTPQLAKALLAATTNTPKPQSNHHPLPKLSQLDCQMLCEYVPELQWTYNAEESGRGCPEWHDRLAPPPRKRIRSPKDRKSERLRPSGLLLMASSNWQDVATQLSEQHLSRVEIKQLQLPGIMSESVFHELAKTEVISMFQLPAVQAIVQCMWDQCVRRYHNRCLIYLGIKLVLLVFLTLVPVGGDYFRARAWSTVWVIAMRDALREAGRIYGYTRTLKDAMSYVRHSMSPFKLIRVTSIALCCALSWIVMLGQDYSMSASSSPSLMTLAVFSSWMHLLSALCVCSWHQVGVSIIPILNCLEAMTGMIVILFVTFAAFLHAFLVLKVSEKVSDTEAVQHLDLNTTFQTVTDSVRILFAGDGEPIDAMLEHDHVKPFSQIVVIAACVFFGTCILNLFVGVYANAYTTFQQKAPQLFLQQRVQQCLHCMLQPQWVDIKCWIRRALARVHLQSFPESLPWSDETPENARRFME